MSVEDVDLSKTQSCKYFVYMDRGNPSQDWRVKYANSIILWHILLQSFGRRNSSLKCKTDVLLYSFCFVLFWIWGQFPSTSPRGLVFEGVIYRRFWGGLYLEGLIFGILRYAVKATTNRIHSDMTISFHRNSNVFFVTRKRIMLELPRVTSTKEH